MKTEQEPAREVETRGEKKQARKARGRALKRVGRTVLGVATAAAVAIGAREVKNAIAPSSGGSETPEPQGYHQQIPGLPSEKALRGYEELTNYILGKNTEIDFLQSAWSKERNLSPDNIKVVITPYAGKVVAKEGLKVRLFPDTDPRFGLEAPPEEWFQYGSKVWCPHEVLIKNKNGDVDTWGAIRVIRHQDEKGEVSQWKFFAIEVNGQKFVEPSREILY